MSGYKVVVGFPFGGMSTPQAMHQAETTLHRCTVKHEASVIDSGGSAGNFNCLWMQGLMAALNGNATHFAMQASDVHAIGYVPWLDILIDEMERLELDLISAAVAIKDDRGLVSCGIGNPENPWQPLRRFTVKEIAAFPKTFNAADAGYPGLPLLHNNQMFVADLRKPFWFKPNENGVLPCHFNFPERLRLVGKGIVHERESEDWYFSRLLHNAGAKTAVTRAVPVFHYGEMPFPNFGDWGRFKSGDEDTAESWRRTTLDTGEFEAKQSYAIDTGDKVIHVESDAPIRYIVEKKG